MAEPQGVHGSPWTQRMLQIVAAEGPIRREELLARVADMVPPGFAHRTFVTQVRWSAAEHGYNSAHRIDTPTDATIYKGTRKVVNTALWGLAKRGFLIIETDDDGVQWVRKGRERIVISREEKAAHAQRNWDSMTPEQRAARTEKMRETLLANRERQGALAKAGLAKLSPEKLSEKARRGWETRRANYTAEEIRKQGEEASKKRTARWEEEGHPLRGVPRGW